MLVPADPAEWEFDPFGGVIKDGYVHGRGAIDCKGVSVVQFLALALLKRSGLSFERDIIFLGTGTKKSVAEKALAGLLTRISTALPTRSFLLTEGGGIRQREGKRSYRVSVAEKAPCWIELKATGPAGHGASPKPETAVTRLVRP